MDLPIGNGYYIWMLSRCAGGDPKKLAQMAKDAGLSYVTIKVADGPYIFNWDKASQKDLIGPAVDALRAEGIGVWGWSYVYSYYPEDEARMAARQVLQYDLDGYMIDAEVEYKGKPAQASRFYSTLRLSLGSEKPIGLCSFRFPSYHPEFPWAAFNGCDFNMPQVYWMLAHNASAQLQRAYAEHKQNYGSMPFFPCGAAFSEMGWTAQPAEVLEFRKTADNLGLNGYCWWEWSDAENRHPELWQASTQGYTPPVIGSPVLYNVMTKYVDLRIRSGPSMTATVLGHLTPNKPFGIVGEEGVWLKLAGDTPRYVHSAYVTKIL